MRFVDHMDRPDALANYVSRSRVFLGTFIFIVGIVLLTVKTMSLFNG
jgi:hypothetical protein